MKNLSWEFWEIDTLPEHMKWIVTDGKTENIQKIASVHMYKHEYWWG